jgi:hypothetical protein
VSASFHRLNFKEKRMADEIPAAPATPVARPTAARKVQKKPYLVVSARETAELENTVSKLILQGYRPHGSLLIQVERDEAYYYQALVLNAVMKDPVKA